jgi:CRP-like cAMP-binding protein
MEHFNSTIQIIRQQRKSSYQISQLYAKLGRIDFFRQYANNDQKAVVYELLSKVKLEHCEANSAVFMRGEIATKFYIVIEGEVAVFLDEDKGNPNGCPYPEFEAQQKQNPLFFDQTTGKFLMNRVAVLKEGQAFGELGVINNKPRLATVIAVKRCSFGILMTDDFRSTLQPAIVGETDKKVRYFKQLLDQSCHFDEVWRLSAFFTRVKFDQYQTIVTEDEEFDRIFVIAEGLIQLTKNINIDEAPATRVEGSLPQVNSGFRSNREVTELACKHKILSNKDLRTLTHYNSSFKMKEPQETPPPQIDLFKRTNKRKIYSQPIVVYGQNQFFGFKEYLESKTINFFSAKVVEPGYGYWIHVSNMRRCFNDFRSFETFFMERHCSLLQILNVR